MTELESRIGRTGYFGDFGSWEEAERAATGRGETDRRAAADSAARLIGRVRDGSAAYARDGIEFDRVEHPYPLLAHLLRIAVEHDNRLALVDFGRALGTTYFQTRKFLAGLRAVRWAIVELPEIVARGREELATAELSFHESLADASAAVGVQSVLLSGVLQYLPDPRLVLGDLVSLDFRYLIFDRTVLLAEEAQSRIVLQAVAGPEGEISWPVRLASRRELLDILERSYDLVAEFGSYCDPPARIGELRVDSRGLVLRRRS